MISSGASLALSAAYDNSGGELQTDTPRAATGARGASNADACGASASAARMVDSIAAIQQCCVRSAERPAICFALSKTGASMSYARKSFEKCRNCRKYPVQGLEHRLRAGFDGSFLLSQRLHSVSVVGRRLIYTPRRRKARKHVGKSQFIAAPARNPSISSATARGTALHSLAQSEV